MYKKKKRINDNVIRKPFNNLLFIFRSIIHTCFKSLSSPETSRQGNLFGILGMVIAITVTFLSTGNFLLDLCSF